MKSRPYRLLHTLPALLCLALAFAGHIACARQAPPASPAAPASANTVQIKTETDVVYGMAGDTPLKMDTFAPAHPAAQVPAIVLIHGGGWSAGDKNFYTPMGKALAQKGFAAFSINYRLLTQTANKYPAQLDDSQRAVRWIRAHADTYGVDPTRIGALGDSAGGYLVALLGTRETRDNSDAELAKYSSKVQAVVDYYGPADFTLPPTTANLPPLAVLIVTNFLGKTQAEAADLYKSSSPITYVDKQAAPFLIIHGTADPLVPVDQSQRLHDALVKAGANSTLLLAYKQGHGFLNPANPTSYGALAEEFFLRNLAAGRTHISVGPNF